MGNCRQRARVSQVNFIVRLWLLLASKLDMLLHIKMTVSLLSLVL